jgi:hypothetical protein
MGDGSVNGCSIYCRRSHSSTHSYDSNSSRGKAVYKGRNYLPVRDVELLMIHGSADSKERKMISHDKYPVSLWLAPGGLMIDI